MMKPTPAAAAITTAKPSVAITPGDIRREVIVGLN